MSVSVWCREGVRFVLIAGEPIGEPVVQHGPFVMNTREEIVQAMTDYQQEKNGFEGAHSFSYKGSDAASFRKNEL